MSDPNTAEKAQMLGTALAAIDGVVSADVRGNADSYIAHVAVRSGWLDATWESLVATLDGFERDHDFAVDLSPREVALPPAPTSGEEPR